jgi:CcmD family protein
MSNWGFVTVAYGLTWAVLGLYTLRLHTRRRALERLWKERKE